MSADGSYTYIAAHIAMAHTFFNVTATVVMLPFLNYLARLVTRMVPDKKGEAEGRLKYMGAPGTIPVAMGIPMVYAELKKMKDMVFEALNCSRNHTSGDLKGRDNVYRRLKELENETDVMQHEITTFTVAMMQAGGSSTEQSDRAYSYVRAADELESIADYATNFSSYMKRLDKHELDFSEEGWKDLLNYYEEVITFFNTVCEAFKGDEDISSTREIYAEATRLNDLADQVRKNHLDRMKAGTCNALPALTFSDMAVALRRIKNHTVNLHEALFTEHVKAA